MNQPPHADKPAHEIEKIANSTANELEFLGKFLACLLKYSGGEKAWLWRESNGVFEELCQSERDQSISIDLSLTEEETRRLLREATSTAEPFTVENQHEKSNTEIPIVSFGSFKRDAEVFVVVIGLLRSRMTAQNKHTMGRLSDLLHIGGKARLTTSNDTIGERFQNPIQSRIGQFIHQIHSEIDLQKVTELVANEARALLDCDRVTVVVKKHGKFKIMSISGQQTVNFKSTTVQSLQTLARAVLPMNVVFWYPGDQNLPPQITKPLEVYLAASPAKTIVIVPLHETTETPDETGKHQARMKLLGGLIFETFAEEWNRNVAEPAVQVAAEHSLDALRNAARHVRLFLYPVWSWIGKLRFLAYARNLPRTIVAIACLLIFGFVLCFFPAELVVRANGQLLPEKRSNVFAEVDGQVETLFVDHGTQVQTGQILAKLRSEEMEIRLADLKGKIATLQDRLRVLELSRLSRAATEREGGQSVVNNIESIKAEISSLEEQQKTLIAQSSKLDVVSPIDGQVLTWNPQQFLANRPVKLGDQLFEVAENEGPWILEILVPDHRAGRVLRAHANRTTPVPVTFVLASEPGKRFSGTIRELARSTELGPDNSQILKVIVDFDESEIANDIRQARSGVVSRIQCGRTSLGNAWLCDIFDFVESEVFFRIW